MDVALIYPKTIEASLMLCDAAEAIGNKLYILGGGWEDITTNSVPARHPRLALAISIRIPWTQTNTMHTFKIWLENEDGEQVTLGPDPTNGAKAIDGQFNVGRPPTVRAGDPQTMNVALNLDHQLFEAAGSYNFVCEVDDEIAARQHLTVHLLNNFGVRVG